MTGRQCSALDSRITTGPNTTLLDGNNHFQHDIGAQRGGRAELTYLEKASTDFEGGKEAVSEENKQTMLQMSQSRSCLCSKQA